MIGLPVITMPGVVEVASPPEPPPGVEPSSDADVSALQAQLGATRQSLVEAQAEIALLENRGINSPQTDWYFAPQSGSDQGDGSAVSPLKTFAEFIRRMGTLFYAGGSKAPASITLHFLEDQSDTSDPVTLSGILQDVPFLMTGGITEVGSGTFGAVTNIDRATAQTTTAFNADEMQPANYWSAFVGMLVNDTTNGTWFRVDLDLGNRKAQLTRPLVGPVTTSFLESPNPLGTISAGDAFVIYKHPSVFLGIDQLTPSTSTATAPSAAFQRLHFITGGEVGVTAQNLLTVDTVLFVDCVFDGAALLRTYPEQGVCANCYATGGLILDGAFWVAGGISPFLTMLNSGNVDGDAMVHGPLEIWSTASVGLAYFDAATVDVPFESLSPPFSGDFAISDANAIYGSAALWGPTKLAVHDNGAVLYDVSATAQILCTGGISLGGLATGAKITPGAPRITTDGIAVTVANIDDTSNGKAAGMISSGVGCGRIVPFK